ncbi:MAG: hypothetical protein QXE31_00100 [Candidatus Woesearchaeota archaeon]
MEVRTEIYYVEATIQSKLPKKLDNIIEANAQYEKEIKELIKQLDNSSNYAVGCSDARYPGIPGMPNSFMAGSRNDGNPDDYRLNEKTRIQVDHHNGNGNACGGRANAQAHLEGKVSDTLYQELANGVNPNFIQNAIEGAGENGIPMVYNHLTGTFQMIQGNYNLPIALENLPDHILTNLKETGFHNGRTNFVEKQDPNYLVLNLALGTLGQYIGSEFPKPLGEVFEVKPNALGISLLAYEPRVVDVASLMYSLDSRLQTLQGKPHGFSSMDTFVILYHVLTTNQEQTHYLIQGIVKQMIQLGPRLGEHLTNPLQGISIYALGVNRNGLILPESVYAIEVSKL